LPKLSLLRTIHISKDPGVFEMFAEGAASIVGLGFAAVGVVAATWLGAPWADGLASIAIGMLQKSWWLSHSVSGRLARAPA
jgi:hypothetical protein